MLRGAIVSPLYHGIIRLYTTIAKLLTQADKRGAAAVVPVSTAADKLYLDDRRYIIRL
jgi:hypothetical protein